MSAMNLVTRSVLIPAITAILLVTTAQAKEWEIHCTERPLPKVVTPGEHFNQPPSDAIILFDGENLDNWEDVRGGEAKWRLEDDYMEVNPDSASIKTKGQFGDCQLYLEWMVPEDVQGTGQNSANSGVFLMNRYEVQILNSFGNETYADGQAGAIYGQNPPLVNASRKPGQWQSYNIIFRRPRFDENGDVLSPAFITVLHNGVLIQDHFELLGPTAHKRTPPYAKHSDRIHIMLQEHSDKVRFRNIWIRDLEN